MITSGDSLRMALETAGKTQLQLARWLGLDPSIVNKMVSGTRQIKAGEAAKIEKFLGVDVGDETLNRPVIDSPQESPRQTDKVPILGGARGGDIETIFFDQGTVQGWRPCPPSLAGVPGAFAVYIVGESMLPKFEPGAMVYVDPNLPPSTGKYVVIDLSDNRAVVKQYVRQNAERIFVREFNPEREFEIPKSEIKRIYRIVLSEEP